MDSKTSQSATSQSAPLYELVAWAELNRQKLLIAVVVLMALGLIYSVYQWRSNQQEAAASQALMEIRPAAGSEVAPSPKSQDYLKVANQYPKTSAGTYALLLAAGDLFAEGKYQEAQTQFENFLKRHGRSPLAPQAVFGLAACLDALNKTDQALAKYQEVIGQYPTESVAAQAKLRVASIYEIKNQPRQALNIYEDMLKGKGGSAWSMEAQAQRAALLHKHPDLVQTNALLNAMTNLGGTTTSPVSVLSVSNKTNAVRAPGK